MKRKRHKIRRPSPIQRQIPTAGTLVMPGPLDAGYGAVKVVAPPIAIPRILIAGTCYLDTPAKVDTMKLWWNCIRRNVDDRLDVLIVNSASPINPMHFMSDFGFVESRLPDELDTAKVPPMPGVGRQIISIHENIGRLETTGRDGPQQAFAVCLNAAMAGGYDYIAHIECDMIFTPLIKPIVDRMVRHHISALCPFAHDYSFVETGALFMDVAWLRAKDYFASYDWRSPPQGQFHEVWFENWADADLFITTHRGMRNDADRLTVNNMQVAFPWGLDFLSHCKDHELYRRMMEYHGIER